MLSAALRALRQDLPTRLQAFTNSPDGELVFDSQLRVCWGGGPVARLLPSGDVLAPKVEALPSDLLDGPAREEVRKRAATWVETRIRLGLSELMDARATLEQLPAGARGIVFQLCEHLGVLPRRPIEQQMAELGEEDRKALAKLGVRVGVYSLYFPSMLKPVPIRLRAGLWMIARNRETIPPLPAEGRTSMDLPQGAERDFYAAIGYLPLGNHAIRADMVERLAAMARQAVRESRENARRAQQEKQQEKKAEARPHGRSRLRRRSPTPPSDDEISEWAIVAAAFGESEPDAAPEPAAPSLRPKHRAAEPRRLRDTAPPSKRLQRRSEAADEPERGAERTEPAAEAGRSREETRPKARAEATAEAAGSRSEAESRRGPRPRQPKPAGPRPLPPGWFRATPQMMSLVGCSEPEMANVLRGLGYRVHPPTGGDTGRCMPSRSSRASCASARSSASASACRSASAASSAAASGRSGRTSGSSSPTPRVATAQRRRARDRDGPTPGWPPPGRSADKGPPNEAARREDGGRATTAAVRGRRAATPAGRRCGSTPRPRRRAMRLPIRPSPSCSSSSSAERNSRLGARCGSTNGSGMPASSNPARSAAALCREVALPASRPGGRQAARHRGARHGADLRAGPTRAGGADRGVGRASRTGRRGAQRCMTKSKRA